jgi:hypothetical protein
MHADTLRQVIANCRRRDVRQLGWPRDWGPGQVRHATLSGCYYTEASAWEFIACKLEEGHAYQEMVLNTPQGASAIEMEVLLPSAEQPVYVKVEIRGTVPVGRSFHYSYSYQRAYKS